MDNLLKFKTANLDEYQMNNMSFDVEKQAWRVSMVDGLTLNVDKVNIPEQKTIEIPVIIKEIDVHQINVPVIIKELQLERIEVPILVKETVYVDRPIIVTEIKIVEIERPIVIKEIELKIIEKLVPVTPILVKICMIIQAMAVIGLLLTNIFLKGR